MKSPFTKGITRPVQEYTVQRWRDGELEKANDKLAE